MAKPRRGIKFNHRNGQTAGQDGRRSSFSDISEAASEPGSPVKTGDGSNDSSEVELIHSAESRTYTNAVIASSLRIREEETNLHHSIDMDVPHDRRIL
jgi:hypothetical protein